MTREQVLDLLTAIEKASATIGLRQDAFVRDMLSNIVDGALDVLGADTRERVEVKDAGDDQFFGMLAALDNRIPF